MTIYGAGGDPRARPEVGPDRPFVGAGSPVTTYPGPDTVYDKSTHLYGRSESAARCVLHANKKNTQKPYALAMLWLTSLQDRNGSSRAMKCNTLTEYVWEVAVSIVVFHQMIISRARSVYKRRIVSDFRLYRGGRRPSYLGHMSAARKIDGAHASRLSDSFCGLTSTLRARAQLRSIVTAGSVDGYGGRETAKTTELLITDYMKTLDGTVATSIHELEPFVH
ncbi:hypothetical protein EVAR_16402_1 [Eumeta japonica]|uniref:Uncharacterized protein n=1 Tax=Eumeta variegata TaxID=151549 RepID=A0A4C1VT33_EUMVA|nr:hypothetical protein EVAR_16402_1 [Eumeta japonica]